MTTQEEIKTLDNEMNEILGISNGDLSNTVETSDISDNKITLVKEKDYV